MTDDEFDRWVDEERGHVERYLVHHGIDSPTVGPWPAFEMAPYFAIWAVESHLQPGSIGWWAFSGDCPADFVAEDGNCHPRNALRLLLERWEASIPYMKAGVQPPGVKFGEDDQLKLLAGLLETRIEIYTEWLENDELWEDR
jgi:hypothetical protein